MIYHLQYGITKPNSAIADQDSQAKIKIVSLREQEIAFMAQIEEKQSQLAQANNGLRAMSGGFRFLLLIHHN